MRVESVAISVQLPVLPLAKEHNLIDGIAENNASFGWLSARRIVGFPFQQPGGLFAAIRIFEQADLLL